MAELLYLPFLRLYVLQGFLELDVALMDPDSVVILAQVPNFLPELLEVVCALHHLQLVARVILLLLLMLVQVSVCRLSHRAYLRSQCLANLLEMTEERREVVLVANDLGQVLHGVAQLHYVCTDAVTAFHSLTLHQLELIVEHCDALLVKLLRLARLGHEGICERLLLQILGPEVAHLRLVLLLSVILTRHLFFQLPDLNFLHVDRVLQLQGLLLEEEV